MDAFPGYTFFDKTKQILCVMQVVEDAEGSTTNWKSVMPHEDDEVIDINGDGKNDNDGESTDASVKDTWFKKRETSGI